MNYNARVQWKNIKINYYQVNGICHVSSFGDYTLTQSKEVTIKLSDWVVLQQISNFFAALKIIIIIVITIIIIIKIVRIRIT